MAAVDVQEFFRVNGYVIGKVDDLELIDELVFDIINLRDEGGFKTNAPIYSYNSSPRIVEAWKHSHAVHRLVFFPKIIQTLSMLFRDIPKPFSTINFFRSTEQPIHSDYVHFGTSPHLQLAAVWVALEDIDPASGPLQVVPGSHLRDYFCYSDLGLSPARSLGQVKEMYSRYETHIKEELESPNSDLRPIVPVMSKGDFLIWDANLLHGSPTCIDNSKSRLSQVTHYHFGGTKSFYNPAFSQPREGKFVSRKVDFIPQDFNNYETKESK